MEASGAHFLGGTGSRLLLLHSGFQTWREWRGIIPLLTDEREVFAPTLAGSLEGAPLPGRGRSLLESLADDLEDQLDSVGWDGPVEIVGSSFGGVVALELAARGRATSVVALAPPWVASVVNAALWAAVFLPAQATVRLTEPLHSRLARWPASGGLYFHGSRRPATIDNEDLEASMRSFGRFPFLRAIGNDRLGGRRMPDLDAVRCPVTFVQGTRDRAVPMWMHRRWVAAVPSAEIILDGFPHCPHLRDPERVAALILAGE